MRLKDIKKIIQVMSKYTYDENKNQRPEVVDCLLLLEREKITRELQARNMRGNYEPLSERY